MLTKLRRHLSSSPPTPPLSSPSPAQPETIISTTIRNAAAREEVTVESRCDRLATQDVVVDLRSSSLRPSPTSLPGTPRPSADEPIPRRRPMERIITADDQRYFRNGTQPAQESVSGYSDQIQVPRHRTARVPVRGECCGCCTEHSRNPHDNITRCCCYHTSEPICGHHTALPCTAAHPPYRCGTPHTCRRLQPPGQLTVVEHHYVINHPNMYGRNQVNFPVINGVQAVPILQKLPYNWVEPPQFRR